MMATRKALASSAAVIAAAALSATRADAQLVHYYTVGTFNCAPCTGSGTGAAQFGGMTLSFQGPLGLDGTTAATAANPAEVDLAVFNPSNASFGSIITSGASAVPVGLNGTFDLRIFQVLPAMGSNSLVGTLTGSLSGSGSSAFLNAPATTVGIGGIGYRYLNSSYGIVPPSTNGGSVSLQGQILSPFGPNQTVPEPATVALLAGGLVLAGFVVRRRPT